jgi:hypothetical protein
MENIPYIVVTYEEVKKASEIQRKLNHENRFTKIKTVGERVYSIVGKPSISKIIDGVFNKIPFLSSRNQVTNSLALYVTPPFGGGGEEGVREGVRETPSSPNPYPLRGSRSGERVSISGAAREAESLPASLPRPLIRASDSSSPMAAMTMSWRGIQPNRGKTTRLTTGNVPKSILQALDGNYINGGCRQKLLIPGYDLIRGNSSFCQRFVITSAAKGEGDTIGEKKSQVVLVCDSPSLDSFRLHSRPNLDTFIPKIKKYLEKGLSSFLIKFHQVPSLPQEQVDEAQLFTENLQLKPLLIK